MNKENSGQQQLFKITGHQICVISERNSKKEDLGTGFLFLKNDWIVTAAHVIQTDYNSVRNNLIAKFPNHVNNTASLAVLAIHNECDIALLKIIGYDNPCSQPLYPGYDELSATNGLICCGYTPSKGRIITISLANIYKKEYRERKETETILEFISNDIEGGSSGGPIFGNGGVVLGIMINTFSIEEEPNKKFARATSIQNLMRAIKIDVNPEILVPVNFNNND
jgi:S1-C subfamily serine protease